MKKIKQLLSLAVFLFFFGSAFSQQIIRTPFLEICDEPFWENITVPGNQGFSIYSVATKSFDDDVKMEIKSQKKEGFKAVDKANLLFGIMRTLYSPYPVEAGMTYRIVAISSIQKDTFILKALKEDGSLAVPEVQIPGDYKNGTMRVQLEDYTPSQNGTIYLQNGTMSMDANVYSAVRYLIFKKKVR